MMRSKSAQQACSGDQESIHGPEKDLHPEALVFRKEGSLPINEKRTGNTGSHKAERDECIAQDCAEVPDRKGRRDQCTEESHGPRGGEDLGVAALGEDDTAYRDQQNDGGTGNDAKWSFGCTKWSLPAGGLVLSQTLN